ncbi:RNA 2',3'-cyclic phosphodiesterase [bacterium]|nr:RNA 2',3'-cyclic phosphodiesterase [bacterium]
MRLFVAVDPGERLRATLATALDTWRRRWDLNWVRPENLHVTLRFLGEQPERVLPALDGALRRAAGSRAGFAMSSGGLGVFPGWRRPRVLFLQLAGDGELEALATSVNEAIDARLGEEPPLRQAFRAHPTLARIKRPLGATDLDDLRNLVPPAPHPVAIREIRLIESRLTGRGPVYVERRVFPLAGAGPA